MRTIFETLCERPFYFPVGESLGEFSWSWIPLNRIFTWFSADSFSYTFKLLRYTTDRLFKIYLFGFGLRIFYFSSSLCKIDLRLFVFSCDCGAFKISPFFFLCSWASFFILVSISSLDLIFSRYDFFFFSGLLLLGSRFNLQPSLIRGRVIYLL